LPLPVLRFSQPSNRCLRHSGLASLFHPAGTRRVWPSKLDLKAIVLRFPYSGSFVVTSLPWLPSVNGRYSRVSPPRRIIRSRDVTNLRPLCLLAETGFHLRFQPTLELCSRLNALPVAFQFHPVSTIKAFLAFNSFRGPTDYPGFPPPFEVSDLSRVLLQPASIARGNLPLLKFVPFDLNFLFGPRGNRGY
jgi:hypothetical protein